MSTDTSLDLTALKTKQQAMWRSGDYSVVGTTLQITGELLCEAVDLSAGDTVLDVAAGNGNAALAAARRGCRVIASDYVPDLLARAAARAEADGLDLDCREADAEALPFRDGEFDAVLSVFGVMFAPDQATAAAELLRVCRPGGRVGIVSWTPGSFVGKVLKIVGSYVAPPPGVASPLLWGMPDHLKSLFGGKAVATCKELEFVFRYRSAEHWVDVFRRFYGPTNRAFAALDAGDQDALEADLLALCRASNTSTAGRLRIPSPYLQSVVVPASND
jgi:SAM-dependent methyltransferase